VLHPGVGSSLVTGTPIKFHYTCYLEYSDEPTDSTLLRGKVARSMIGEGDVLPGMLTYNLNCFNLEFISSLLSLWIFSCEGLILISCDILRSYARFGLNEIEGEINVPTVLHLCIW